MRLATLLLASVLAAPNALAEPPAVAVDIPPVHSLVARVMQGVGEPALILPPGASPHGYAMRPSEAAAIADAALVVWTGAELTPWLADAIDSLAPDAAKLALLDAEGTTLLEFREGTAFEHDYALAEDHDSAAHGEEDQHGDQGEGHAAGHEQGHAGGHAHDNRDHERSEGKTEEHADAHDGGHGHDHGGVDPHAWLDPGNARAWLGTIADALSDLDPDNAAAYASNAAAARDEIDALTAELSATLAPVRDEPFVVFHDGYHYFEHRFGIEAAGAIADSDAAPPGPARISEIRETLTRTGASCVFAEPQLDPSLIETVIEGTRARIATLDPLGTALPPGPELYPQLLRDLATGLRDCLEGR